MPSEENPTSGLTGTKRTQIPEGAIVKRQKTLGGELVTRSDNPDSKSLLPVGVRRTSNLKAPIMELTGHEGEVYSTKFSFDGRSLASASFDKTILLWEVYDDCKNYNVLRGHKNAVLDVHFSTDSTNLYSASADKTCVAWDLVTSEKRRTLREHTGIVNSCYPARRGPELLLTASDDGTVKLWDLREKHSIWTLKSVAPVTSVSFSDNSSRLFFAGLDNVVHCWDIQSRSQEYLLEGHQETITSIALSPDGTHLLSNSMDNSVRVWDVKPYVTQDRCVNVLTRAQHNYEGNLIKCNWSPDGTRAVCGSSDKFVYVWDVKSAALLYQLPGHKGCVNEVSYHPSEPIIASCSSDKTIVLGEIETAL